MVLKKKYERSGFDRRIGQQQPHKRGKGWMAGDYFYRMKGGVKTSHPDERIGPKDRRNKPEQ